MGRCKSLGSLKSFLWFAPQLSGASTLFSHPEFPRGSPQGVAAVWRLLDGRCSFLPEFLQSWPTHHPWWWLRHPCLLIRQKVSHFSKSCPCFDGPPSRTVAKACLTITTKKHMLSHIEPPTATIRFLRFGYFLAGSTPSSAQEVPHLIFNSHSFKQIVMSPFYWWRTQSSEGLDDAGNPGK